MYIFNIIWFLWQSGNQEKEKLSLDSTGAMTLWYAVKNKWTILKISNKQKKTKKQKEFIKKAYYIYIF